MRQRETNLEYFFFQDVMSEYERIKRSCLKRGELWEDPEFPATQTSVFYHQTPPFQFQWKRPKVKYNYCHDFFFRVVILLYYLLTIKYYFCNIRLYKQVIMSDNNR